MIDSGQLSKGHGKALLTEPDHHRQRVLARRAVEAGWSVRALEKEIGRGAQPRPEPPTPHADHQAAAARLQDAISRVIGGDARARPHRHGYQVILDQTTAHQLAQLLAGTHREART
jgi:ParB family chromosome partitioning protein